MSYSSSTGGKIEHVATKVQLAPLLRRTSRQPVAYYESVVDTRHRQRKTANGDPVSRIDDGWPSLLGGSAVRGDTPHPSVVMCARAAYRLGNPLSVLATSQPGASRALIPDTDAVEVQQRLPPPPKITHDRMESALNGYRGMSTKDTRQLRARIWGNTQRGRVTRVAALLHYSTPETVVVTCDSEEAHFLAAAGRQVWLLDKELS